MKLIKLPKTHSNVHYIPISVDLLNTAGISELDELNIELLPIQTESDSGDHLTFGLVITKQLHEDDT
jgi:3-polyprenyl-4-hydroxybenzoate decarboxylase